MDDSMDFEKYKPRLKELLRHYQVDLEINPTHCFNPAGHSHGDTNPSLQLWDDGFKCHGCGIQGDIYDAVEILEGITDKKEQYKFVEKFFGEGYTPPPAPPKPSTEEEKDFEPDKKQMEVLEAYLHKNPASEKEIKRFLADRANYSTGGAVKMYPEDLVPFFLEKFFYWPGFDTVIRDLGRDVLKGTGIPLVNQNTQRSTWEHSGVVMRLGMGYKLHYYEKRYCDKCKEAKECRKYKKGSFCWKCEKRTSKKGQTFPMPGEIDTALPVILVEGEMDALACAASGIKNLFAVGGTNGLTGPKVKKWLLDVPEIILCFDAEIKGRKASGLEPLEPGDGRKSNVPQIIRRAGYTGKIRLAELPLEAETGCKDQDALVLAGRRDVIERAIQEAKEYTPPVETEKEKDAPPPYVDLGTKRLRLLLHKLKRDMLAKEDVQPFITACVKAFSGKDVYYQLKTWGASQQEINEKNNTPPGFIVEAAGRYLSRYMARQLRRELTPTAELYQKIMVQDIPIKLEFDELEINENARNFVHYAGIRSGALMLADIFDGRIVYNAAKNEKRFYFFNGHIWKHEPDITGVIYNTFLLVIHRFLHLLDTSDGDAESRKKERNRIIGTFNKIEERRLRIEIQHEFAGLRSESVYHNSDDKEDVMQFDGDAIRESITLADGVMDFSGDEVVYRTARADEWRRTVLPYTVAQVKGSVFPEKFMAFMRGNFKNADTLETLMYYLSLIPSRTQYKYGAFWIGGKNTGKSTTIKLVQEIYQHIIGTMEADILVPKGRTFAAGNGPTPYLAQLRGLGASITSETEEGAVLNEGLWKKLTGDDTVNARGLNEAPKEFRNTAQIIISTNELPKFNRHDNSVITRMVVIPFLVSHEREDKETKQWKDLLKELSPEFPGVIRLLAGYYIKLKNTLGGIIPISRESEQYKLGYIAEVETDLDKYVAACISFEPGFRTAVRAVYDSYLNYYEFEEGAAKRGEALSFHRFTRLLQKNYREHIGEASVQRIEGKPTRCFIGLKLRPMEEVASQNEAKGGGAEDIFNGGAKQVEPPEEENPF
jgi:hypothetical protein